MTSNHLLLYRLAELMLNHDQHILNVDMLFEDEQIGDFVKNIQIDSPFQQNLADGVLTEIVENEELRVSFTVEGYFHYVLGEVIYKQNENKGPEILKQIIEKKSLKGATAGVEQCLIRDVEKDELSRLIWLIDQGGKALDACIVPLAHALTQKSAGAKSNEKFLIVERVLAELLFDPTDFDLCALEKAIECIEQTQNFENIKLVNTALNGKLNQNSPKSLTLLAKSVKYIDSNLKADQLKILDAAEINLSANEDLQSFYSELGSQYKIIGDYSKSLKYFEKSLELAQRLFPEDHLTKAIAYSNVGSVWSELGDYDSALKYYSTSLEIRITIFGNFLPSKVL